ncbi:hypothetical protein ACIOEX_21490, partial [Streptomyces sp. NPDC087850]
MGQHAVPEPGGHTTGRDGEARAPRAEPDGPRAVLGRAVVAPAEGASVGGVVLVLPEGAPVSTRGPSVLARARMAPLARSLARAGAPEGLVVHVVRYTRRGWNGAEAALAADADRAVQEVVRRYGDVPVCLAGHGMGGRAALRAAGHPAVNSVLAMAPWLPEADEELEPEPVRQLVDRQVLI